MPPLHLVFFDTNAEAIGQWVVLYHHLTHLELFPYGSFWYQEQATHWQQEGIEAMQEIVSETSPSSILKTTQISPEQPEAVSAFMDVCRTQNWPTVCLSESNYQIWLTSTQMYPHERYQLAQKLAEDIGALAK